MQDPIDNPELWWKIRGEVIGWLSQDETGEDTIAVVLVNAVNDKPLYGWPVFCLRWIGNDYSIVVYDLRSPLEDRNGELEIHLGDIIEFSTNTEEQRKYAARN